MLRNCLEHNTEIKKNTGKVIFKDMKAKEFSRNEEKFSDQQCISKNTHR